MNLFKDASLPLSAALAVGCWLTGTTLAPASQIHPIAPERIIASSPCPTALSGRALARASSVLTEESLAADEATTKEELRALLLQSILLVHPDQQPLFGGAPGTKNTSGNNGNNGGTPSGGGTPTGNSGTPPSGGGTPTGNGGTPPGGGGTPPGGDGGTPPKIAPEPGSLILGLTGFGSLFFASWRRWAR
jgi:hypothetical protein